MTRNDIRRMYTQKVSELLAKGYQVHFETMSGSQGELAHIDLTDGNEVLRVLLERECCYGNGYGHVVRLRVGRCTEDISRTHIIWNNRLDTLFEIEWDQISETFYTTRAEGVRMADIRLKRWNRRKHVTLEELGDAYKAIALRWLRRQPRMKSCRLEDITQMTRQTSIDGRISLSVAAKGKTFILRA